MKIGDRIHNSVWVTGDESEEMRKDYIDQVTETMDYFLSEKGFARGPVIVTEHRPDADLSEFIGDNKVPDHIQGSKVRLMVVEADIIGAKADIQQDSFVYNLERKDLMKLRKITRDAYVKHFKRFPTMQETDEIIDELGPDAAVEALRGG